MTQLLSLLYDAIYDQVQVQDQDQHLEEQLNGGEDQYEDHEDFFLACMQPLWPPEGQHAEMDRQDHVDNDDDLAFLLCINFIKYSLTAFNF